VDFARSPEALTRPVKIDFVKYTRMGGTCGEVHYKFLAGTCGQGLVAKSTTVGFALDRDIEFDIT
jgi:hypothetical protein